MTSGPPDASEGHPNIVTGTRSTGNPSTSANNVTEPSNAASANPIEELSQRAIADINSIRNFRNAARKSRRMNGQTDVSDDEEFISEQQLSDAFTLLARQSATSTTVHTHNPTPLPPLNPITR
jgi:hypothetical protein